MTRSGIAFDPAARRISINYGSRVAQTTDGNLLCYDPVAVSHLSMTVAFPQLVKDIAYIWTVSLVENADSTHQYGESAVCYITACPQEYTLVTELETAPAGADFFQSQVRLHRSVAPSHSWMGRVLGVIPVENQWMLWSGSQLLEADFAIARMLSVYIDNNPLSSHYRKLCLKIKQSVGQPTHGYGVVGGGSTNTDYGEVDVTFNTTKGTPFFLRSSDAYGYTSPQTGIPLFTRWTRMKPGGALAVPTDDPTDMRSTYIVDVVGNYGIRS
jgi:hypothetical protein